MICFLFLFPDFGLHSGPKTPTYTSFSLRLLLDQPPYWHQSGHSTMELVIDQYGEYTDLMDNEV
jgi:hypothetical protein